MQSTFAMLWLHIWKNIISAENLKYQLFIKCNIFLNQNIKYLILLTFSIFMERNEFAVNFIKRLIATSTWNFQKKKNPFRSTVCIKHNLLSLEVNYSNLLNRNVYLKYIQIRNIHQHNYYFYCIPHSKCFGYFFEKCLQILEIKNIIYW